MSGSKISKILVVHHSLEIGGATHLAISDALSLRKQGFTVGFASEGGAWEEKLTNHVPLHRLCFLNAGRYPRWFRYLLGIPVNTVSLLCIVLRHGYNCLYVHHRQSGIPSTIVSWLTKAIYVFIAHVEFSGGRSVTRLGRHVIADSEKVRDNLVANFGVRKDAITVIPNAVEIQVSRVDDRAIRAFDSKWGIPPDAQVVACVALLNEQKAHNVLLDAWQKVMVQFPRAILVLAGDGPLRGRLEDQSAYLGIEKSVRFLGMVDELPVVYSRAGFVVLSSRAEGMPLCILEAFAYGLPAVATAVSGTPEIVLHQKTGLLVEPNKADQLAQAIIRLLSDPRLRRQLGEAARQLVVDKYSFEARERVLSNYFRALEKTV